MPDAIELSARYSFITNKLRYCGPHDSYLDFLKYLKKPSDKNASIIKDRIKRFEGLWPYLELIAKKHGLDPFDYRVVESYWIGNDLLEDFDMEDLKEMIFALTKRGLPRSYAKKLADNIPEGMTPHHSFNVIYVGVGKVTGSVPTNINNMNNCLIRTGTVKEVKGLKATVEHTPYSEKLVPSKPIVEEFDFLPEYTQIQKGDTVSIHWRFVVEKIKKCHYEALRLYNTRNLNALRRIMPDNQFSN